MALTLDNRMMRRLWLDTNGLLSPSAGPLDIIAIIKKLGFVQLDTIQNVSRAHHHILWSRHPHYREPMLDELLQSQQHIFEHYTHDALSYLWTLIPCGSGSLEGLKQGLMARPTIIRN